MRGRVAVNSCIPVASLRSLDPSELRSLGKASLRQSGGRTLCGCFFAGLKPHA